MSEPLEVRQSLRPQRARTVQYVLLGVLAIALLPTGLLALATRAREPGAASTALLSAAVGAWYGWSAYRGLSRQLAARRGRKIAVRLDDVGVHVQQTGTDAGAPDAAPWWLTLPWNEVSRVVVTHVSSASSLAERWPVGTTLVRFVAHDDASPDPADPATPATTVGLRTKALWLGLTPTQARLVWADPSAAGAARIRTWVQDHRPSTPVDVGTATPWTNPTTPDAWPGVPRVAVLGTRWACSRALLPLLVARFPAPPVALSSSEAARSEVEAVGAELRLVDPRHQGPGEVAVVLRGCGAVVVGFELRELDESIEEPDLQAPLNLLATLTNSTGSTGLPGPERLRAVVVADVSGLRTSAEASRWAAALLAAVARDERCASLRLTVVVTGGSGGPTQASAVLQALTDDSTVGQILDLGPTEQAFAGPAR